MKYNIRIVLLLYPRDTAAAKIFLNVWNSLEVLLTEIA